MVKRFRERDSLQRVLDALVDGILVLSSDGRVVRSNAEACRILEASPDNVPDRGLASLFGERHPITLLAQDVQKKRKPVVRDGLPIQRRFGEPLHIECAVSPLPDDDGEDPGVVLRLRDRTIGDNLREEVRQREDLARYGHIAAGIAHEVKNPLGGIRGAGELLRNWASSEREQDAAGMIVREVDRITALVEELMVFARGEELEYEEVNLHQLIDDVIALMEVDPLGVNVDFQRAFDPSIPPLVGDASRLTQVFLNLCRNAVQAMGEQGGRMTVTTRMSMNHRVFGPEGRPVPTVEVLVEDDGPGIPEEILDRLATPFFTTKANGTGLGLAVSRHWITRHGGRLQIGNAGDEGVRDELDVAGANEVHSTHGARIRVDLPLRGHPEEGGDAE